MHLMYIGAYLPTNSNNYDNFKKALEELRKQNTKWKKKIPKLFIYHCRRFEY